MKTKKILTLILVTVMVCTVLSSCGGDSPQPSEPSSSSASSAPATVNEADTPADVSKEPEEPTTNNSASETTGEGTGGNENDPMYIAAEYLMENAGGAFIGATDAGEDIVFIETEDMAVFLIANGEFQNVSFVGGYEVNDFVYTIYDDASGLALTFEIIEIYDDGSVVCDVGDIGQFALSPTDVETAVFAMLLIAGLTDAVF